MVKFKPKSMFGGNLAQVIAEGFRRGLTGNFDIDQEDEIPAAEPTKVPQETQDKANAPQSITKQRLTQISTSVNALENQFSAISTYQSNIQKINNAVRVATAQTIRENQIEMRKPAASSVGVEGFEDFVKNFALFNIQLNKVIEDLENMNMSSRDGPSIGDAPQEEERKGKKPKGRARGRTRLRPRRLPNLKGLGKLASRGLLSPAGIAVGTTIVAGQTLEAGLKGIEKEARKELDPLSKKYGMTPIQKNGITVGWNINGVKYTNQNLPEYYKRVLDAEGPGVRRGTKPQVEAEKYLRDTKQPSPPIQKATPTSYTVPKDSDIQQPSPAILSPGATSTSFVPQMGPVPKEKPAPPGTERDMEKAIERAGIKDPVIKAQIMAQTAHESGNFRYTREVWVPTGQQQRYEGRKDLGNVVPGDGYKYKGRGFLQITGRANYAEMSRELGVDFVNNPDLLSTPKYASISALAWFKKRWNTIKNWGDVVSVTRVVNGGYNGLGDRAQKFSKYLKKYGVHPSSLAQQRTAAAPKINIPKPSLGGSIIENISRFVGVEQKVSETAPIVVVQQASAGQQRPTVIPGQSTPPQSTPPNSRPWYQMYFGA